MNIQKPFLTFSCVDYYDFDISTSESVAQVQRSGTRAFCRIERIDDPDLTVHQAFSVEMPTRFFIRPDRYVANVMAKEIKVA